jgi:hypothetical protein
VGVSFVESKDIFVASSVKDDVTNRNLIVDADTMNVAEGTVTCCPFIAAKTVKEVA